MSKTKNLGQVSGLYVGKTAPSNTSIIWYDDTPSQSFHKVYDATTNTWKALSPDIVSNTTYSELVMNAEKNGLSVGKHYIITDKSNTLAIAITTTKVQYVDSLGNILIDDLGTNIQYHVSSSNLLIDDVCGVFDEDSNKLIFQFTEQDYNIDTDFIFGKVRRDAKWILSKFNFSSFISKKNNNSITWSGGLFFSFKSAINNLINKKGGVVGYDNYTTQINQINNSISNISKNNQDIVSNANDSIDEKTTDEAIFSKKLQSDIDIITLPGDVLKGDSLFTIVSKFQRWVNKFKFATGIQLSKSFTDAKTQQYINNNDTVESAFSKIQYMLKNPTTSGMLPDNWNTNAILKDPDDPNTYGAFEKDKFPVAGDSIFYAFAKIVDYMQGGGMYSKLSSKWIEIDDISQTIPYPIAGDTIDTAFQKIVAKLNQIGEIEYGKIVNGCTTFDLLNGSLQMKGYSDTSFSELKSNGLMVKKGDEIIADIDATKISMKYDINNEFFHIDKSKFYSKSDIYDHFDPMFNDSFAGAYFECDSRVVYDGGTPSALQARNLQMESWVYDAYMGRLKADSLTLNSRVIKGSSYYMSRYYSHYMIDYETNVDLYLPHEVNGAIIYIIHLKDGSNAVIHTQYDDLIRFNSVTADNALMSSGTYVVIRTSVRAATYPNASSWNLIKL